MMKNDNRNERKMSGSGASKSAGSVGRAKAPVGKGNRTPADKGTKTPADKGNKVPGGQGRKKAAVKKKSGLCPVADKCGGCSWINQP